MTKKIRKWFWFWEFEKEEQWLNEMAQKGLKLCKIYYGLFCNSYIFENCLPNEYTYRKQFIKNKINHPENLQYFSFLKETGVEVIEYRDDGKNVWVYFCKKTSDGPLELYSDIDSKISHYNRVIKRLNFSLCMEAFCTGLLTYHMIDLFDHFFKYKKIEPEWLIPISILVALYTLIIILFVYFAKSVHKFYKKRKELKKERNILQ